MEPKEEELDQSKMQLECIGWWIKGKKKRICSFSVFFFLSSLIVADRGIEENM
jgi:hypothetical protein